MCVLLVARVGKINGQAILFSVVFTPPPSPSHYNSVWLLPVISLLLTNTASPVWLAYPYGW